MAPSVDDDEVSDLDYASADEVLLEETVLSAEELLRRMKEREGLLQGRSFLLKDTFWKLNHEADGSDNTHWRERLCVLNGVGDFKYVSKKEGGVDTQVTNKSEIVSCEKMVATKSQKFIYPHAMVLRYRGNKKAKHSESLDSPIPSEPPKNERNKGTNEEETAEVEMTFCAPSEETVDKWITALKPAVLKSTHHFHSGALLNKARSKVSGNRRRYQQDGFDLDLTYITSRLIAMAFPAEDKVGEFSIAIRNDSRDVRRFFDSKHKDRYMLFNLCAEKQYDSEKFEGRAQHIPFLDHNPPSVRQIKLFCHSVDKWLKQHPRNIVAVHCKGGKGRTGVMCAAWLLYEGHADGTPIRNCQEAAKYFADKRTLDPEKAIQGVTGLSQMEALILFEKALKQGKMPSRPLRVKKVEVKGVPFGKKGNEKTITPYLRISTMAGVQLWMGGAVEPSTVTPGKEDHMLVYHVENQTRKFSASNSLLDVMAFAQGRSIRTLQDNEEQVIINEDYRLELYDGAFKGKLASNIQKLADSALCFRCLHTSTHTGDKLVLDAKALDKACKDVGTFKKFPRNFSITMTFEPVQKQRTGHKEGRGGEEANLQFNEDVEQNLYSLCDKHLKRRDIEAGDALLRPGDRKASLCLVATGSFRAEIERSRDGTREVIKPMLGVFELIGRNSFLTDREQSQFIVANEDSTYFEITAVDVPKVGAAVLYHALAISMARERSQVNQSVRALLSQIRSGPQSSQAVSPEWASKCCQPANALLRLEAKCAFQFAAEEGGNVKEWSKNEKVQVVVIGSCLALKTAGLLSTKMLVFEHGQVYSVERDSQNMPALLVRIVKLPPVTISETGVRQNQCLSCVTGTRNYSGVGSLQQGAVLGTFKMQQAKPGSTAKKENIQPAISPQSEHTKRPDCVLRLSFDNLQTLENAETALKPLMDWDLQQKLVLSSERLPAQQSSDSTTHPESTAEALSSFTLQISPHEELPKLFVDIGLGKDMVNFVRVAPHEVVRRDESLCYVIAGSVIGGLKCHVVECFAPHHIIGLGSLIEQGHSMVHHREIDTLQAGPRGALLASTPFSSLTPHLEGDEARAAVFWQKACRYLQEGLRQFRQVMTELHDEAERIHAGMV